MKTYYFAHSCQLINTARRWQLKIEGRYNLKLTNPFLCNDFESVDLIKNLKTKRKLIAYTKTLSIDLCTKIVERDLELLRQSDGLIALFGDYTAGTMMEIMTAAYLYKIPVFIICGEFRFHPWLQYLAKISGGGIFKTRKAFEEYLDKKRMRKL